MSTSPTVLIGMVCFPFYDVHCCVGADRKVLCLGIIQSLFEGSMYTFVLEWTPALTPAQPPLPYHHDLETSDRVGHRALSTQSVDMDDVDDDGHRGAIPHGFIFAAFMVTVTVTETFTLGCIRSRIFRYE